MTSIDKPIVINVSWLKPKLLYKLSGLVVLLNAVDVLLTWLGLNMGFTEANPFASFNPLFLAYKFGLWIALLLLIKPLATPQKPVGLLGISMFIFIGLFIYAFVVVSNFALILGGFL